ncbi:hypothetical protein TNCV_2290691 [Trichonephila clavipes]|uniref:Uncharacterized protein n=1 Tax=Trichonephila clavipes TaxID=2585209 RepID=A0A8X6UX64_TRICX|nr:hypothetical protein TNCV_2290691 [Trichonephila clavipes]
MWTPQQKVQCVLWLKKFNSVTRVQRRVRTEWNADPLTSKSIQMEIYPQWERPLKERGTLVSGKLRRLKVKHFHPSFKLTQFLTGHGNLKAYLKRFNLSPTLTSVLAPVTQSRMPNI